MKKLSATAYENAERVKVASIFGCKNLPDESNIRPFMRRLQRAAEDAGATVVKRGWFHTFPVQGITIVLVLAESAVVMHTYPERRRGATINVAVCGTVDPEIVCANLIKIFEPCRRATSKRVFHLKLPKAEQ